MRGPGTPGAGPRPTGVLSMTRAPGATRARRTRPKPLPSIAPDSEDGLRSTFNGDLGRQRRWLRRFPDEANFRTGSRGRSRDIIASHSIDVDGARPDPDRRRHDVACGWLAERILPRSATSC